MRRNPRWNAFLCLAAPLCPDLDTAVSCEDEVGCDWLDSCTGEPPACVTYLVEADCSLVNGCGWTGGTSSGSATACADLTVSDCESQVGCVLVE